MAIIYFYFSIVTVISVVASKHHHVHHKKTLHILSDEYIDHINSFQDSWVAGRNFHKHTPLSYLKGLAGSFVMDPDEYEDFLDNTPIYDDDSLPEEYDTKTFAYCYQLPRGRIRDQGSCSSCWAVAVASAMSDRICIMTNGAETDDISEDDLMDCCKACSMTKDYPCDGGFPENAWIWAKRYGVVSGGLYGSIDGGCKSYQIPPCNHTLDPHDYLGRIKPQCVHRSMQVKCQSNCSSNKKVDYMVDKKKVKSIYKLVYDESAQKYDALHEILKFGPITATFTVYSDFYNYKGGVYVKTTYNNREIGNHTVKILGWGEENGLKYWYAANSWNTDWGDKGYFKIIRGRNECNIESNMFAGLY